MKKVGELYREVITQDIKENLEKRSNTFLVGYTGVSGLQMSNLRKDLKRVGARLYVSKNSLAQRALNALKFNTLADSIEKQTALVFSDEDSVEVSKVLVKFAKDCEGVLVKGGLLEGRVLVKEEVKRLSELPSKDILRATLMGTIQAPLTRLLGALNGKSRELISLLKQLSEKKGR